MSDQFRTLIVAAPVVEDVRTLAATWPGGQGMFTVALTNDIEPTHYISTGYISADIANALPLGDNPGDIPALVEQINEETGGSVTVEQVNALLAYADISDDAPYDAMARLGLSIADEEIA